MATILQPGQQVEPQYRHLGEFHREDYVREMFVSKIIPEGSILSGMLRAATNLIMLVDTRGNTIVGVGGVYLFPENWLQGKEKVHI